MDHDEQTELTEAYVLGGLSADERRRFEAHVATCTECARDVRELMRVTEVLGRMVEQREPPPHLRERVLEAARQSAVALPPTDAAPSRRGLASLVAAAAIIAAIALGIYAANLRGRATQLETELAVAREKLADSERELVQLRETAGRAARARLVLAASDVTQVELGGQAGAPNALGRAFWSGTAGLVFSATNLPPLPPGKVYQLWVVTKSQALSAGLLTPDGAGRVSAACDMPPGVQPVQIALSIEPAGGVPAPTGQIVLVGVI